MGKGENERRIFLRNSGGIPFGTEESRTKAAVISCANIIMKKAVADNAVNKVRGSFLFFRRRRLERRFRTAL